MGTLLTADRRDFSTVSTICRDLTQTSNQKGSQLIDPNQNLNRTLCGFLDQTRDFQPVSADTWKPTNKTHRART